ncbi:hypothetical protein [Riemerella anatipestifer]|uniref:hypothetical protein n=1 Tax=Riemerella anatipestifer TaxID=34085 RepID=UPI00129EFD85|nr:hypothetical protein [Riemerella anatipestifer]MRM82618.1 hypothetical protein [Riemerella anatipestifer]
MTVFDLRCLDLDDQKLSEKELIERLSFSKKEKTLNFNLFSNLICTPVGYDEFLKYKGVYLAFEVLRQELGFDKKDKPGDFDILLIPYSEEEIFYNRTCAIEVKVVRPRRNNPRKSPNSYGITQIEGLIKDGFPLVGLIHFCMPEPLRENEKSTIKLDLAPLDIDNPANNNDFLKNTVDVKFDHFSQFSAENQMRKLISKDIPKYVGINTVGVNIRKNGSLITLFNQDFNHSFSSGYFNPYKSSETIEKIKSFFEKNQKKIKDIKINNSV